AMKLKEETLLFAGMVISVIGSCLLLLAVFADLSFWLLIAALFLVVSSVGMVNTTSFSLGMQRQGKAAGSASAFLGILPFSGGALVSPPCLSLHSSELPAIIRLYRWRLLFSRVVCWRLCCISCWQGIRDKLGLGRRVFNKKALGFIPAPFK